MPAALVLIAACGGETTSGPAAVGVGGGSPSSSVSSSAEGVGGGSSGTGGANVDGPFVWKTSRSYLLIAGVAVDAQGNTYVVGAEDEHFNFDHFSAKVDPGGSWVWEYEANGSSNGDDFGTDVEVLPEGIAFMPGILRSPDGAEIVPEIFLGYEIAPVDGGTVTAFPVYTTKTGQHHVAVERHASISERVWGTDIHPPEGRSLDEVWDIATGPAGETVVVGRDRMNNAQESVVWLAKLDAEGAVLWERRLEDPPQEKANGVAVDAAGSILIAGAAEGAPTLRKLSSDGTEIWRRSVSAPHGSSGAADVAVLPGGGSVAVGWLYEPYTSDPNSGVADHAWVWELDADGNEVWAHRFDHPEFKATRAESVAVDASGDLRVGINAQGLTHEGWVVKVER